MLLEQMREQSLDLKSKLGQAEQQATIMRSGKELMERELIELRE